MPTKGAGISPKDINNSDELEAVYANTIKVGFNAYEFVLDFGQHFDDKSEEHFHTRIVTTPKYVENFIEILGQSLLKFMESN